MALKVLSNTTGGQGGALSSPMGPWQSPGGGPGAKPPESPEILHFIVPENDLNIHIFPVCCTVQKHRTKYLKLQPSLLMRSL